ncbi:MAG: hypothetical protein LBE15_06240, partial [Burkholderiales bacterium]|nr:hypothetical protein [Burkholderiales bacterium]
MGFDVLLEKQHVSGERFILTVKNAKSVKKKPLTTKNTKNTKGGFMRRREEGKPLPPLAGEGWDGGDLSRRRGERGAGR